MIKVTNLKTDHAVGYIRALRTSEKKRGKLEEEKVNDIELKVS